MTARSELTPQMLAYQEKFNDSGEIRWLPYLMYFHPAGHRSETVNTDAAGFRYTDVDGDRVSAAELGATPAVRLLAGSSTVFGIGATADAATMSSRMTARGAGDAPWLNFGGRSFNSTQELVLFTLYRHLLPEVSEIVLLSGFNNLGLARAPAARRGDHGEFFNSGDFHAAVGTTARGPSLLRRMAGVGSGRGDAGEPSVPSMDEQIAYATGLTLRHLDVWRALAADMGARLTYVLQPLAGWVRAEGAPEEEALFAELDELGRFSEVYGDISDPEVGRDYSERIAAGAAGLGVGFVDLGRLLAASVEPDEWLFVDRIHFNDAGYDRVASLLLSEL